MELKLYPTEQNYYPLQAIFIRGISVTTWLSEMELMHINLKDVIVYPLPGLALNSLSGCLVIFQNTIDNLDVRKNIRCQRIGMQLYLPEYTNLTPQISLDEIENILSRFPHFLHPELGLIELDEEIAWHSLLSVKEEQQISQIKPQATSQTPENIKNFRISVVPQEGIGNILNEIEKSANIDKLANKPLTTTEKLKLSIYKKMMGGADPDEINEENTPSVLKYIKSISHIMSQKDRGNKHLDERLLDDYNKLYNQEKNELDKLLDLLRNDPEKALDYAVPIDDRGTARGEEKGGFRMNRMNNNHSSLNALFKRDLGSGVGGYYSMEDDEIIKLQNQYRSSALQLIQQKKYLQASYIYIKLLKNNYEAATMFEDAKLYKESGDVYKELIKNNLKAAECYEKGKLYEEAIEILKNEHQYEKVGDLYIKMRNKKAADIFYKKEIDRYVDEKQYIKAAELSAVKMEDIRYAQSLLLQGWTECADPYNCLGKYFSNIEKKEERYREIKRVFENQLTKNNREGFLQILKKEYLQNDDFNPMIKDFAYQIISNILPENKYIAGELIAFNKNDNLLLKDTLRYKQSRPK